MSIEDRVPLRYSVASDHESVREESTTSLINGHIGKNSGSLIRSKYIDGDTINWFEEEADARVRAKKLRSGRGVQGFVQLLADYSTLWFVVGATGIGIGVIGGWLDVLVAWLADLRLGRCEDNIFYNQVTCCKGYDPGETCLLWLTWGDHLGIRWIALQSLVQSFIYVTLSVGFAASAAILVQTYAPYAFHTGIPEIKAILGGYVLDEFLTPWTLLIKAAGLALSVASGLSLGKEGPLVHVSCCTASLALRWFNRFRYNEAEKRRILAAAAAAGVSVAFGSPLGGVLFALEDVFHEEVMWRSFVTSVIAAVSLQYIDPFGTSKLVLFQVTTSKEPWRAFELVPWLILGIMGGVLGTLLIKLNVSVAVLRQKSQLKDWPLMEVLVVSGVTAAISYLVIFMRMPSSELVANLFQECDGEVAYHGLCNPSALVETVFLLLTTATLKIALTAWTFGMMVPAGIFLPTIAIGACVGRAFGLAAFHRLYPTSFIFAACPPDPSVRCISPGFYAVIGSAATLAGVTRMTISLVVILFELTGALSHVLPIMIAVMSSKWVADSFGKDGIYSIWIAMKRYPWISPTEYRDGGRTSESSMIPKERIVLIEEQNCTIGTLKDLIRRTEFHGYPVTSNGIVLGYIARARLREMLRSLDPIEYETHGRPCVFSCRKTDSSECLDLSQIVEVPTLHFRKEVPLELVVTVFQKMNLRYLLFSQEGSLTGMLTKSDIVSLLSSGIEESGALAT